MNKHKGQIAIAVALSLMATFIGTSIVIAWNSNLKADKAVEKVSEAEASISGIQSELKGMNDKLDMLTTYFKLTPRENQTTINK